MGSFLPVNLGALSIALACPVGPYSVAERRDRQPSPPE
jgi:hypothetical protein